MQQRDINDLIPIGVFSSNVVNQQGVVQDDLTYLKTYRLTSGEHLVVLTVKGKPERVSIDPYFHLIGRDQADNSKALTR